MNQNYSPDQLLKLCKHSELSDNKIRKEDLVRSLVDASARISDGTFDFNLKSCSEFFITEDLVNKLVLRKLNDNLKRLYKDEQSNRRVIINQITTLFEDTCPFWILRTDISQFYESIDRDRLVEKLQGDAMLSYFSIWLLRKLFSHPLLVNKSGLPRGIGLSATLSEIYMRKFDRWARTFDGVYYYARFVDDIIIFSDKKQCLEQLKQLMDENLEKGLKKNKKKTSIFAGNTISFKKPLEYLGYQFTIKTVKSSKFVNISIAEKKIKKIKSRIAYSFADFIKNKDYSLLEKRIKFLTGNYSIRSRIDGNDLRAGIYYNYCNIDIKNTSVFQELNIFFQKILFSKRGSFGIKLSALLSPTQKSALSRYSFIHGFKNKVYHTFNANELKQISSCWK